MNQRIIFLITLCALLVSGSPAQTVKSRDFLIHKRGLLWETVYNTGEIGRAYSTSAASEPGKPIFQWPGNSATSVDGKPYNGQNNSFGGGIYLAADTGTGASTRVYSLCGASDQAPYGVYSFPLRLDSIHNYPINADGSINPSYDPNEAEERIIATWGTNLGVTITRTSRAWSNSDYDDCLIYEYELENTGDKYQTNLTVVHSLDTLKDMLVSFVYGLVPSEFGDLRWSSQWKNSDYEQKDARARFDRRRWLNYSIDRTGRQEKIHFAEWAPTGINGGGLLSPQAVGYMALYCDTAHLAHKGESRAPVTTAQSLIAYDANLHFKQPFSLRMETGVLSYVKAVTQSGANMDIAQAWSKNSPNSNTTAYPSQWIGRGSFNWRQARYFAIGRMMTFGPYIMNHGDKIKFSIAEVAGYGAANHAQMAASLAQNGGKNKYDDEGGGQGQMATAELSTQPDLWANNAIPSWDTVIQYGAQPTTGNQDTSYGSYYLKTYKLPDYVNSDVVTIRDVADRALQAYNGGPMLHYDSTFYWPENAPNHGVYRVPQELIAPVVFSQTDSLPRALIYWNTSVDILMGPELVRYEIYRSPSALGPWTLLDTVERKDTNRIGNISGRFFNMTKNRYEFPDYTAKIGETWWYSVASINTKGKRSNLFSQFSRISYEVQQISYNTGSSLQNIYVVPNPFLVRSGFGGDLTPNTRLCFMNLPPVCTIRIYSYDGQLLNTIDHASGNFGRAWYQVTRNNQQIASGVYFFVVSTPSGGRTHGKFVVIR